MKIEEPGKKIPLLYDVDVAIAGGGIAGVFAAIAAGRLGVKTVLIDRFGIPGGNMGPGMITGGGFHETGPWEKHHQATGIYGDITGIPREFIERHVSYGGGAFLPYKDSFYIRDSNVASHIALEMLEEAGVTLVLSAYVADPIREEGIFRGLFVETKSGRQAVLSKVVIDGTGEADLARRAGLPVLQPKVEYHELDKHSPNGMGIWAVFGGVDCDRYEKLQTEKIHLEGRRLGELGIITGGPTLVAGKHSGRKYFDEKAGLASMRIGMKRPDSIYDAGDARHVTALEAGIRRYILDLAQKFRREVPGFENAYVLSMAPYLAVRGGPCIVGEYTLTMDDLREAKRFDDVIYLYGETRALAHHLKTHGEYRWTDMPYRVMVPKGVDGLLAVGRSASGIPDTLLRNRLAVMHMGQAGGTAAALAVKHKVSPRGLPVRQLQEALLEAGFYLGGRDRLRELGLAP